MSNLIEFKNKRGRVEFFNLYRVNAIRIDKVPKVVVYIYFSNGENFTSDDEGAKDFFEQTARYLASQRAPWFAVKDDALINLNNLEAITTEDHSMGKIINFRMLGGKYVSCFFDKAEKCEETLSKIRAFFHFNSGGNPSNGYVN